MECDFSSHTGKESRAPSSHELYRLLFHHLLGHCCCLFYAQQTSWHGILPGLLGVSQRGPSCHKHVLKATWNSECGLEQTFRVGAVWELWVWLHFNWQVLCHCAFLCCVASIPFPSSSLSFWYLSTISWNSRRSVAKYTYLLCTGGLLKLVGHCNSSPVPPWQNWSSKQKFVKGPQPLLKGWGSWWQISIFVRKQNAILAKIYMIIMESDGAKNWKNAMLR